MRLSLIVLACLNALIPPAMAIPQQGNPCRENAYAGKPVNPAKTDLWQREFAGRDQGLMAQIAGTWYAEVAANIGGQRMVSRQWHQLSADGNFAYQDQTCSVDMPQMPCSQNQGAGLWAGFTVDGGAIYIARNFSDLNRANECSGMTVRFGDSSGRVLVDAISGQVSMQRVQ